MFAFARRPEPQRRPIGAPGISIEQYERIAARLQAERTRLRLAADPMPRTALTFQRSTITEGTRL